MTEEHNQMISRIILIAIFFLVLWFALMTAGCSFKPIHIDTIPEECNLAYSAMSLVYHKNADKSLAIFPMERCSAVLQRERCRKEIYGEKAVDYQDLKKYRDYSECLKELK